MLPTKTKTCNRCDQDKPLGDFHRNRARHDGLMGHCKECARVMRAARARKLAPRKQPDAGNLETLYVRVPADLKQKVVLFADKADLSIARAATALLGMSIKNIERVDGPLEPKDV